MLYPRQIRLFFLLVMLLSLTAVPSPQTRAASTVTLAVPDGGWRLWPDTAAAWQNDNLYLPGDIPLSQIAVNPPTGGWGVLTKSQGMTVTLPSTVEQHYWGKFGFRLYNDEDSTFYNVRNPEVKNGNYRGVSWWWTSLQVPSSFAGGTVILHIRAARQRAEVYLNQKLVGYSMIEGTGFDCDVSGAIKPGQANQLAIRITNPGGRMDWNDLTEIHWGKYVFCGSRGFGGLDRGITLTAHAPVYLSDSWTLNTAHSKVIEAHATLHNSSAYAAAAWKVRFSVLDPQTNAVLAVKTLPETIPAGSDLPVQTVLSYPSAKLWNLKTPNLYRMRVELRGPNTSDTRDVTFGFRSFAPDGVGTNALLRLNGERIRVYSAISWGFWGLNGYFPTPALAVKEVTQAKRLGLNCLNFHRNLGHPEVLDAQDRLGLLRYMEPGGGRYAVGEHQPTESGAATTFGERYMEDKILGMIRDERSHPSLVVYNVQNETSFDFKNPRVFYLLHLMHREDPSRTIVLKSGIPPGGEAWMQPYDDTVYYDHGDGYSGWWDMHTADSPDAVWQDAYYHNPDDYLYRSVNAKEIVDWGEAAGAGTLDDHALMVKQIQQSGGESYDLQDHQEQLDAYNAFLDKWGFRAAFPTASSLFHAIGDKQYDFWSNLAENVRLSDATDFLTISGWETTAIDDHSGMLDNLRNFHGDPDMIRDRLAPLLPVAKPRHLVLRAGEAAVFDLTLLNETNQPTQGSLHLSLTDPAGRIIPIGTYATPAWQKDRFVYPIQTAVTTPPLTEEGIYHVLFSFDGQGAAQQKREIRVVGIRTLPGLHVGVVGSSALMEEINSQKGVTAEPYRENAKYDLVAYSPGKMGGQFATADLIKNTPDPKLYQVQRYGTAADTGFVLSGLPPGPAQVTLLFAETYMTQPGMRKFDVIINGQTVLHALDIFAEAGGKDIALQKTVTVNAPEGSVEVAPGNAAVNNATFAGIKVTSGGITKAIYFGDTVYTDQSGQKWMPSVSSGNLSDTLLNRVRAGMPLLVDISDDHLADVTATLLAQSGAFHYDGLVGRSYAAWMGSWYFVRAHPVYDGLPVNEAMKSDYQVAVAPSNGLRVDGPGVQVIVGYSRDHSRTIGAGTFTAPLGKGTILFQAIPPMNPVIRQRWLANALAYLAAQK